MQAIRVPANQEAARLYWTSRSASLWHRDAAARSALERAATLRPAFAPVFRDLAETLWSDTDVEIASKVEAIKQLSDRAKSAGDAPLATELTGILLLKQNEPAKAAATFSQAVKAGVKSPEPLLEYAEAVSHAGDGAEFESILWKLISDFPARDEPYLELYAFYIQSESEPQAQRVLTTWAANCPQDPTGMEIRARDYVRTGRTEAAEMLYQRLLAEHSDDADILESVGVFYAQANRLADYLTKLEEMRARDPWNLPVSLALVEAYSAQGKNTEASGVIDAVRSKFDKDTDVLYVLSGLYSRIGQKETGEQVLNAILKLEPTHAGACNDLGYQLAEEGKTLTRAESLVRQAVTTEPHNSSFLDSLGWVLYKLGRFAEARRFLDRAVGITVAGAQLEADPVSLDHRGDVLYRLGDRAAAGADWQQAADRITSLKSESDDLKELRLQLLEKQKQLSAGQPVKVAPAGPEKP